MHWDKKQLWILNIFKSSAASLLVATVFVACGGEEPEPPTPPTPVTPVNPDPPIPAQDTKAPTITVSKTSVNVIAGLSVSVSGDELKIGDESIATWKDDVSTTLKTELTFTPASGLSKTVNSGDKLSEEGTLGIKVLDEAGNSSSADISLTAVAITGLETLKNKELTVDTPADLLEGLTITEGLTLTKVEIEENGTRNEVTEPKTYTPEYPGTVNIILTISKPDGNTIEVRVDGIRVTGLPYNSMPISNLKPRDILPIVDQVKEGDKQAYYHIEHIRLAEATKIRDMMWEYGTEKHSKDEYQRLMGRLMTGMMGENPKWYDNYVIVGNWLGDEPDNHGHDEWHILNTLVKNAVFFVLNPTHSEDYELYQFSKKNPNSIIIIGNSTGCDVNRNQYNSWNMEIIKECDKQKNLIIFQAWSNIDRDDETHTIVLNKVIQEEYDLPDEHSTYGVPSRAHGINDNVLDRHLLVTVWTNKDGDKDLTKETSANYSKFPVGFHPKVLFSWRTFPRAAAYNGGAIHAEWGSGYATSLTNYVNVCMMDICFQLYAEVADVDELLEMVRSTALTDYIRLDGMTQPLQLINPAGFYKKYLTPTSIPSSVSMGETIELQKGYYKGIAFNIPGAEVKIGDEWIPFDSTHKDLILAQNPMHLTWRINGNLLKKMGYTTGQTIEGQIITVDDQWNGLRLEVPMTITIN